MDAGKPVLRSLALLSAIFLLGFGIAMLTASTGGATKLIHLELDTAAALLKVPPELTRVNLAWLFKATALIGYSIINVGAIAVCAVSGRRRVHSAVAAALSGTAAAVFLATILTVIKGRVQAISKALDTALDRYFKAFQATGDEKFLSQIHLQYGCCGLETGPGDFEAWMKPLPSSCCGLFTGSCVRSAARPLSCRAAMKRLSGDDGFFNLGHYAWWLSINCAVLSGLMLLLVITDGGETVEMLIKLRLRMEEKWRSRMGGHKTGWLGDQGRDRDSELRRVLKKSTKQMQMATGGPRDKQRQLIQLLLEDELKKRNATQAVGGSQGGVKMGHKSELERKLAREIDTEKARLMNRLMSAASGPPPSSAVDPRRFPSPTAKASPPNKVVDDRLRREAEIEKKRVGEVLAGEAAREKSEAPESQRGRSPGNAK